MSKIDIWTIANQKGGVGKTTTTVTLAGLLAQMGKHVLVIDLDPHASLSHYFGLDDQDKYKSVFDIFAYPDKPDWYAGFVQLKGKSINCIDGAKWLLTDKRLSNENTPEYQFIIMLNDTNWGIACHNLVDTVLMFTTEVKWRDIDIKRPWMAGLVKEQMCAMLDTYQLTAMLDAGLNSDQT